MKDKRFDASPKSKQTTVREHERQTRHGPVHVRQHFRTLVNKQWGEPGEVTFSYGWKEWDDFYGVERFIKEWDYDVILEDLQEKIDNDDIVIFEVQVHPDDAYAVTKALKEGGRLERDPKKIKDITIFHGTEIGVLDDIKREGRIRGWFIEEPVEDVAAGTASTTSYARQQTSTFGPGRKTPGAGTPVVFELKVPEDAVKPSGVMTEYLVPRGLDMGEGRRGEDNRDWIDAKYIQAYWTWENPEVGWVRHEW